MEQNPYKKGYKIVKYYAGHSATLGEITQGSMTVECLWVKVDREIHDKVSSKLVMMREDDHPNLVRCLGEEKEGNQAFIAIERIYGRTLRAELDEAIQDKRYLPEPKILEWFSQIVHALNNLHERGLVHGSLDPNRVIINGPGKIKVDGYGLLACRTDPDIDESDPHPSYFAPEIRWLNEPFKRNQDIWALGALLFEMCFLEKCPWNVRNKEELQTMIPMAIDKQQEQIRRSGKQAYSDKLISLMKDMLKLKPTSRPTVEVINESELILPDSREQSSFNPYKSHFDANSGSGPQYRMESDEYKQDSLTSTQSAFSEKETFIINEEVSQKIPVNSVDGPDETFKVTVDNPKDVTLAIPKDGSIMRAAISQPDGSLLLSFESPHILVSVDLVKESVSHLQTYGIDNASGIYTRGDKKVIVVMGRNPSVLKDGLIIGLLNRTALADRCHNVWTKDHRLSASVGDNLYLLADDRFLVRYSLADIDKGVFDNESVVAINVSDFCVDQEFVYVLTTNGSVIKIGANGNHQTKNQASLEANKMEKWSCIKNVGGRVIVMATKSLNLGVMIYVHENLNKVLDSLTFKLTSNGHSNQTGGSADDELPQDPLGLLTPLLTLLKGAQRRPEGKGSELMFAEVVAERNRMAVMIVAERDGFVHVVTVSKHGKLSKVTSFDVVPPNVVGKHKVIWCMAKTQIPNTVLIGGWGWSRTVKIKVDG